MIDQTTLTIEKLYLETGSYIDAVVEFAERYKIYDFEDILEVINPLLREKIKQEFIDKGYIPNLKKPSIKDFMRS